MQTRDHKKLGKFMLAEMGLNIPYLYQKAFILTGYESIHIPAWFNLWREVPWA